MAAVIHCDIVSTVGSTWLTIPITSKSKRTMLLTFLSAFVFS